MSGIVARQQLFSDAVAGEGKHTTRRCGTALKHTTVPVAVLHSPVANICYDGRCNGSWCCDGAPPYSEGLQ